MPVTTTAARPGGDFAGPAGSTSGRTALFRASPAGFAKALFRGEFRGESLFPYPELPESQRPAVEEAVAAVREFADTHIDAAAIDRDADIPALRDRRAG